MSEEAIFVVFLLLIGFAGGFLFPFRARRGIKVWAIIDRDPDHANDHAAYRNRDIYILFSFSTRNSAPYLQVFEYRHRNYADVALRDWIDSGSHPEAELVEATIIL